MVKKISEEVKEQAIKLVEEHGISISQVAKELSIGRSTLDKWLKIHRTTVSNGLTIDERAELKRLRKENRELRQDKELLKKATVNSTGHCNV